MIPITPDTFTALKRLRQSLPKAANDLNIDLGDTFTHWKQTLDSKLLPRLHQNFPLVTAICGGGSTGKSSLFNSLIGHPVSPTGGRAGLNRRVLVAISSSQNQRQDLFDYLGNTFNGKPQAMKDREQLLCPGPPLYCESETMPQGVVLLDTPDIDTGSKGQYANRDLARQCLEVADLFLYIFTNATYNNLDNTDFIARMLTGVGTRPSYLIYRVYPSFTDDEVRAHARVVAQHIYGSSDNQNILGLFRVDENNAVATGQKPMDLQSMDDAHKGLAEALTGLDPVPMRTGLLATMLNDALSQAGKMAEKVHQVKIQLNQYAHALETAQRKCVQNALSHFPTDRVLRRFAQIWLESDPTHIKLMRNTGKVLEWPVKTALKTVRWLKNPKRSKSEEKLALQLELDLLTAANRLYKFSVDSKISIGAQHVTAPEVVHAAQARLEKKPWQVTLETISTQKNELLKWSSQLDAELKALAVDLRRRMGVFDQVRQTFAAMLNVIPATAAVTYILQTGDPVGATGIKVKLTGLLGLNDLYALIAIPATTGMSKADRKQLEHMLAPLARTWLAHKLKAVQDLFETHISGDVFDTLRSARNSAGIFTQEIDKALTDASLPSSLQ